MSNISKTSIIIALAILQMSGGYVSAQRRTVDSLNRLLKFNTGKLLKADTNFIKLQLNLAHAYCYTDPDSTQILSTQSLALSQKLAYNRGIYVSLRMIGLAWLTKGDYINAYKYIEQSYTLAEQAKDKEQIANSLYSFISLYDLQGDYSKTAIYINKALSFYPSYKNEFFLLRILSIQAEMYSKQNKPDSALNNLLKILIINKHHQQAGYVGKDQPDHVNAYTSNDIGNIYLQKQNPRKAIPYFKTALNYYKRVEDDTGLIDTYTFLAKGLYALGNYDNALSYGLKGYEIAKTRKLYRSTKDISGVLYPIYSAKGDYKKAFFFLDLNKRYTDSTFNETRIKELGRLEAKYDFDKKQINAQLAYSKKEAISEKKSAGQVKIITATLVLLTIALFFIITAYMSHKRDQRSNVQLSNKNKEIALQADVLREQATQLNDLNNIKNKLFSIIAHDLRTPLVSFIQMLNLVNDDTVQGDEFKEMLPQLLKQVSYTSTMLENLLAWSNSQMNGFTLTNEEFDLASLVDNSILIFEKQITEKQITVKDSVDSTMIVNADRNAIELVIRNLIANAIKFTPSHGNINITAEKKNDFFHVLVSDTGRGMAPSLVDKLFNHEVHSTMGTANEKGTGLGLKICKEFIERSGGKIWVKSELNKGSTFGFSIPVISTKSV